jgi:hypothetical protein
MGVVVENGQQQQKSESRRYRYDLTYAARPEFPLDLVIICILHKSILRHVESA